MQGALTTRARGWPLAAGVTALGLLLGPGGSAVSAKPQAVTPRPAAALRAGAWTATMTVAGPARRGETLAALLIRGGLAADRAQALSLALGETIDVVNLPPGLVVTLAPEGLTLKAPGRPRQVVKRTGGGAFALEAEPGAQVTAQAPDEAVVRVVRGQMQSLLYGRADAARPAAARTALTLLARELDLSRDVALDSPVELALDGPGAGDLLYLSIVAEGRQIRFYRVGAGYRSITGRGAGPAPLAPLIQAPLDGGRMTSGFGMRLHPLLGFFRLHQGIDLGAPVGAPVLAATDGVIAEAQWRGGYGRWVRLSHGDGLDTGYGHLSGWAAGVRPGLRVRQGQVIGYVGQSGLATGPHLHFEVAVHGKPIDPALAETLRPPPEADEPLFRSARARIDRLVSSADRGNRQAELDGLASTRLNPASPS